MAANAPAGVVSSRVQWLIGGACAVTILLVAAGMQSIWDAVEWVEDPYFTGEWTPGRSAFWYTDAVALAVSAAIALALVPRFRLPRLLRVAVLLPVIHLAAIVVAAKIWLVFDSDTTTKLQQMNVSQDYPSRYTVELPSVALIGAAFAAMVAIAIVIKRRHGEWAHATVTLALSYLLVLGLWLPLVSRLALRSVESRWYRQSFDRILDRGELTYIATIPAAIVAIAFVALMFRRPELFERHRQRIRLATWILFGLAMLVAMSLPDKGWVVYLESSYLIMAAVVLAVAALSLLAVVAFWRSLHGRIRRRGVTYQSGVIADDGDGEAARFEITSSLRGPRPASRPFTVTTPQGTIPVTGASLHVPVPASTVSLDVGQHVAILPPGTPVTLGLRTTTADGHPFRASDVAEVAFVSLADDRAARESSVVLVGWRPAVAYLTILIAVALPYLTALLD